VSASPRSVVAVVLTFNEERNLPACLASLDGWCREVVVIDSGSTDRTTAIAREHGARVLTHPFETHARQWQWALASLPADAEWVLALDADQRVTAELRDAIAAAVPRADADRVDGYFMARRQIFRGRWIRHGGYYPKYLLKLFRRSAVVIDEHDLVDHHFRIAGRVERLRGDLVEDNQNEAAIFDWIEKHNRYARLQAREELRGERSSVERRLFGNPDERVAFFKQLWSKAPRYGRSAGYFFYRYVLRLGFLDGKEGFVFHVLQAFWYRLLVDINIDEQRRAAAGPRVPGTDLASAPPVKRLNDA